MPNGYTADIYNGDDITLRDYLMQVGRGMSMAIMQRDDDPRAPIKLREISDHHSKALSEALAEKHRLLSLTTIQRNAGAAQAWREQKREHEASKRARDEMRARYQAMIDKVEAWQPEAKVAYVKEHALKYLRESMDFDCSPGRAYPADPGDTWDADQWFRAQIESADWSIEYHDKGQREELKRVADFNEHILAFYRSLPDA